MCHLIDTLFTSMLVVTRNRYQELGRTQSAVDLGSEADAYGARQGKGLLKRLGRCMMDETQKSRSSD
jgi:hypothetical protein